MSSQEEKSMKLTGLQRLLPGALAFLGKEQKATLMLPEEDRTEKAACGEEEKKDFAAWRLGELAVN